MQQYTVHLLTTQLLLLYHKVEELRTKEAGRVEHAVMWYTELLIKLEPKVVPVEALQAVSARLRGQATQQQEVMTEEDSCGTAQ